MTPRELRCRRLALGWSVEQLAVNAGVSSSRIQEWEQGLTLITRPVVLDQIFRDYAKAVKLPIRRLDR